MQVSVFRTYARIIKPGRDGMGVADLPVFILKQVGAVAVQYTGRAACEAGGM